MNDNVISILKSLICIVFLFVIGELKLWSAEVYPTAMGQSTTAPGLDNPDGAKWLEAHKMGIEKEVSFITPDERPQDAVLEQITFRGSGAENQISLYQLPKGGFILYKCVEIDLKKEGESGITFSGIAITFSQLIGVVEALNKCERWIKICSEQNLSAGIEKVAYDDKHLRITLITPNVILCKSSYICATFTGERLQELQLDDWDRAPVIKLLSAAPKYSQVKDTQQQEEAKTVETNRQEVATQQQEATRKKEEDRKKAESLLK